MNQICTLCIHQCPNACRNETTLSTYTMGLNLSTIQSTAYILYPLRVMSHLYTSMYIDHIHIDNNYMGWAKYKFGYCHLEMLLGHMASSINLTLRSFCLSCREKLAIQQSLQIIAIRDVGAFEPSSTWRRRIALHRL